MELVGVKIQKLDVPNKNNRVYKTEMMQQAVDSFNKRNIPLYGCVGVASYPIQLDRVSHEIKNLRIEGDYLVGDAKVLGTQPGNMLKTLIEANEGCLDGTSEKIAFRPAGTGMIRALDDGTSEVYDYELTSIDLVNEPA